MDLYISTSTINSFLLLKINQEIDYIFFEKEHILETIDLKLKYLLEKNNKNIKEIKNIIINTGPGNFMSLKIGMSFIFSFSKILNINCFELSSFDILFPLSNNKDFKLIYAKKNQFYAKYKNNQFLINENEIDDFVLKNNIKNIYKNLNIFSEDKLHEIIKLTPKKITSNNCFQINYIRDAV